MLGYITNGYEVYHTYWRVFSIREKRLCLQHWRLQLLINILTLNRDSIYNVHVSSILSSSDSYNMYNSDSIQSIAQICRHILNNDDFKSDDKFLISCSLFINLKIPHQRKINPAKPTATLSLHILKIMFLGKEFELHVFQNMNL